MAASASAASRYRRGVTFAALSALMLGSTPVLGKIAIDSGLPPLSVVAIRTAAASLLLLVVLLPRRSTLAIFPLGLVGCLVAGLLNGIGSLCFYVGLGRIDAGVGQMLFSLYPVWVALLLYLDGQRPSRLSLASLALSVPAVYLITSGRWQQVDPVGAGLMLLAGFLFALHLPINERVLYEVPAPTVAFYTLAAMTFVVVPAYLIFSEDPGAVGPRALPAMLSLTAFTFISRLALFSGVKSIGGFQSSLLGVAEVLVAVSLAYFALGESLTAAQEIGGLLLATALLTSGLDRTPYRRVHGRGWLYWLRPPVAAWSNPSPSPTPAAGQAATGGATPAEDLAEPS
jgi:drug/metabolite transporter (DMT)-like permease